MILINPVLMNSILIEYMVCVAAFYYWHRFFHGWRNGFFTNQEAR